MALDDNNNSSDSVSAPIYWTTVKTPTNIAIIKYWGKANVEYNTPLNSSMSVTLDLNDMCAVTTVAASKSFTEDKLWLNGVLDTKAATNKRFRACIDGVKALATDKYTDDNNKQLLVSKADWQNIKFHVSSYNTFPTAAGLASSAAGYAALVFALATLMQAKEEFLYQLSTIARQGSGSACRSLYGGFVAWHASDNPIDSKAQALFDADYWPEMRILVLVAQSSAKHTPSTTGMQTSVATSPLLQYRAKHIVPDRMRAMQQAWSERDFASFAKLCMQDSNQFHATCLDTYPPIAYLNDVSHTIIRLVHAFNEFHSNSSDSTEVPKVAYTFDAGPNAVLYGLKDDLQSFKQVVEYYLMDHNNSNNNSSKIGSTSDEKMTHILEFVGNKVPGLPRPDAVQRMIETKVGQGPLVCTDICNLDPKTGENTYKP